MSFSPAFRYSAKTAMQATESAENRSSDRHHHAEDFGGEEFRKAQGILFDGIPLKLRKMDKIDVPGRGTVRRWPQPCILPKASGS